MEDPRVYYLIEKNGDSHRRFAYIRYNPKRPELVLGPIPGNKSTAHHRTYHDDGYLHTKFETDAESPPSKFFREAGENLGSFSSFGKLNMLPMILDPSEPIQTDKEISESEINPYDFVIDTSSSGDLVHVHPFIMGPHYPIEYVCMALPSWMNMKLEGIRIRPTPWIGVLSLPEPSSKPGGALKGARVIPTVPTRRELPDKRINSRD